MMSQVQPQGLYCSLENHQILPLNLQVYMKRQRVNIHIQQGKKSAKEKECFHILVPQAQD